MTRKMILCALSTLVLAAPAALADWDVGDPHKMHYPQLPDPFGIDVSFRSPQVLADDWQCSETGPVSDVHFWFSALEDAEPVILNVHLSIHSNIPAGEGTNYSRPGDLLWQGDFGPGDVTWRPAGTGQQGWYVPENGFYRPFDHNRFYQLNIVDLPNPFIQQQGEVYWLDISISSQTPLGWKTSISPQFMDTSVWGILPTPDWQPVYDPRVSVPQNLDLAFVITPEPASLVLVAVGAASLLRRRSRS